MPGLHPIALRRVHSIEAVPQIIRSSKCNFVLNMGIKAVESYDGSFELNSEVYPINRFFMSIAIQTILNLFCEGEGKD